MKHKCLAAMATALLCCSPGYAQEPTASEEVETAAAAQAYGAAWASRDVEKIVSLHTDDSVFVSHLNGPQRAIGKQALRSAFQQVLTDFPDYASAPRSFRVGPGFVVLEYDILSGPGGEFVLAGKRYRARHTDYRIAAIDVVAFDSQGKVTSKHTYIDALAIQQNADLLEDR